MEVIEAFKEMQKNGLGGFKLYVELIEPWLLAIPRYERMRECAEHSRKLFPNGKHEIHNLDWFYPHGKQCPERYLAVRRALYNLYYDNHIWCRKCEVDKSNCRNVREHMNSWVYPQRDTSVQDAVFDVVFTNFVWCPVCQSSGELCSYPETHSCAWKWLE
jgi:hypothetical protein